MTDTPEWFVKAYIKATTGFDEEDARSGWRDGADKLWAVLVERGWQSSRLLGGEPLPDGTLRPPMKMPTLELPLLVRPETIAVTTFTGLS